MNTVANFRESLYSDKVEQYSVKPGTTIWEWLKESGYIDKLHLDPIVVVLNGEELMEIQYDAVLKEGDVLELQQYPRAYAAVVQVLTWIYYAVIVIAAVKILTMPEPGAPNSADVKDGSPTYSINARGNRFRPGTPGPILYGTLRIVPDFDETPYNTYDVNNDQTLHMLFRLTQGKCDVDLTSITFEDTPLSNFDGVQLEVIQPGAAPTLFPAGVVQSNDMSNVELLGGYTTAYVVNDINTQVNKIEIDVSSSGLGNQDKKNGNINWLTVTFRVYAQQLNATSNTPIGGWVLLGTSSVGGMSADPIRRTFNYAVTPARYQVRLERLGEKSDSQYVRDELTWATLKGYIYDATNHSTCTRLAISVLASEKIGNRSLSDMSVVCKRKLPTWNSSTGWSSDVQTNSIAWALADLCRAQYAGDRSDLNYDLPKLAQLDAQLTPMDHEFNAYFDTEGTSIWDALIKAGTPGRITPIDKSGFYTFVRDEQQFAAVHSFTMRNIVRNSFRIEHSGVLEETADAIVVSFQDEDNDYRIRTLSCALPDSLSLNPREIDLFGVTNATRAKELGMFMAACNRFRRKMTPFSTGIEGRIPFYGSKIAISHYLFGAEGTRQVSGDILAWDGGIKIQVSTDVIASQFTSPHIVMTDLDGLPMDPVPVSILTTRILQVGGSPDWSQIRFDPGYKRPMFIVGEGTHYVTQSKVIKIERKGEDVSIEAFVDDDRVYAFGDGVIPPDDIDISGPQSAAPVLSELKVYLSGTITAPIVSFGWSLHNADKTLCEKSTDGGITWTGIGDGFTFDNKLTDYPIPGIIRYRFAAVNLFKGPWVSKTVNTFEDAFDVPPDPTDLLLAEPFIGRTLEVWWLSDSERHVIEIWKDDVLKYTEIHDGTTWSLDGIFAQGYGIGRSFTVRVYAVGVSGKLSLFYTELAVSNPAPPPLDELAIEPILGVTTITYTWPSSQPDIAGISVWMSSVSGFTPNESTLNIDRSIDRMLKVPVDQGEVVYVRVAAVDVWGYEGLSISGQYMVTGGGVDLSEINDALDHLQDELDDVNATLVLVNADIDDVKDDMADVRGDMTVVQGQIVVIHSDLDGLAGDISDVNSDLAAANSDISSLEGKFPITATDISNGAITTPKLAANSITADKIVANSITGDKIVANTITGDKIAANAISSDKIVANAITTDKLNALAVTAEKVSALAITTEKIAALAITAEKIAALAITADKIAANAITADKLAANSVSADKIVANSITGDKLAANSITADKIQANTITTDKLAIGTATNNSAGNFGLMLLTATSNGASYTGDIATVTKQTTNSSVQITVSVTPCITTASGLATGRYDVYTQAYVMIYNNSGGLLNAIGEYSTCNMQNNDMRLAASSSPSTSTCVCNTMLVNSSYTGTMKMKLVVNVTVRDSSGALVSSPLVNSSIYSLLNWTVNEFKV